MMSSLPVGLNTFFFFPDDDLEVKHSVHSVLSWSVNVYISHITCYFSSCITL